MLQSEQSLDQDRKEVRVERHRAKQRKEADPTLIDQVYNWKLGGGLFAGKARVDLNGFVLTAFCLVLSEFKKQGFHREDFFDSTVHGWIADFLGDQGYKRRSKEDYTPSNIKKIVYDHFDSKEKHIRDAFQSLIEHAYQSDALQANLTP
jgi:hypothetical protein